MTLAVFSCFSEGNLRLHYRIPPILLLCTFLALFPPLTSSARAQGQRPGPAPQSPPQPPALPTREDLQHWIATNLDTPPQFQEREVLTQADLDNLRAFLPPRCIDEFNFPGVEFHVSPSGNYAPHPDYLAATEQYSNQSRLAEDGALEGYLAGRPFAQALINPADPRAGLKPACNFNYRRQFY